MDLKTFVKEAVTNIVRGVEEVSAELSREVELKRKDYENIEFDVAVTVEENNSKKAGLQILKVFQGGVNSEAKSLSTSRIRFSLYVNPNTIDEDNKQRQQRNNACNGL